MRWLTGLPNRSQSSRCPWRQVSVTCVSGTLSPGRSGEAELAGAGPARDDVEAGVGQMALEPAVESDAVILDRDGELADLVAGGGLVHAVALASQKPMKSSITDPATEETA